MSNMVLCERPVDALSLMDQGFDDILDFWNINFAPAFNPRLEVRETEKDFRLSMEVPGMKRDEIHIEVEDGVLRLHGEKKSQADDKDAPCRYSERTYGSFERTLRLPDNADAGSVHAKYADGLLELTIPKREVAKPKTLEVKIE